MRVLVTGGAGFIGSHLTDAFLSRGDEVTVIDTGGRATRLDGRVAVHKVSITDVAALTSVAEEVRPELICHLAAQIDVRVSVADPAADAQANVVGTVNVLEAARGVGARVLFASTGGAHPAPPWAAHGRTRGPDSSAGSEVGLGACGLRRQFFAVTNVVGSSVTNGDGVRFRHRVIPAPGHQRARPAHSIPSR
ncbi:MAG: NAD-dependent epimerase/dehydratase family protein [Actinomycetia bacterium]|nr:NAD-dependent epimerase/dehydratase family protein [Actinomycetes bacterium]